MQAVLTEVIGDDAIATYDDSLWGIGAALLVEMVRTVGDGSRAAVMRRVLVRPPSTTAPQTLRCRSANTA